MPTYRITITSESGVEVSTEVFAYGKLITTTAKTPEELQQIAHDSPRGAVIVNVPPHKELKVEVLPGSGFDLDRAEYAMLGNLNRLPVTQSLEPVAGIETMTCKSLVAKGLAEYRRARNKGPGSFALTEKGREFVKNWKERGR